MKIPFLRYKQAFLKTFSTILGAIIGAIGGVALLVDYGGNYGCFAFMDTITGLTGYESCGSFGFFFGAFMGGITGFIICRKLIKK